MASLTSVSVARCAAATTRGAGSTRMPSRTPWRRGHHMFMKLEDGRVYCLPEGYEVEDRSLDPIRYVLNPTFPPRRCCPS